MEKPKIEFRTGYGPANTIHFKLESPISLTDEEIADLHEANGYHPWVQGVLRPTRELDTRKGVWIHRWCCWASCD